MSSVDALDTKAEIATLGVDSILAAQLGKILSRELGIKISPMDLFEAVTLDGLFKFLEEKTPRVSPEKAPGAIEALPVDDNDIVAVGMACRFPQSEGLDAYWKNLMDTESCLSTTNRWGSGHEHRGGFLEDISLFDAAFFRISPNEARSMDPQQRLLLEVTQHAIEDTHVPLSVLREQNCGVFVTSLPGDYKFEMAKQPEKAFSSHSFLGNAFSALAGRISYYYDLKGPSVNLDTACSSSLVAIHQACLNIQSGQCQSAIVGAASVFSTTEMFEFSKKSDMYSGNGRCAVFDDSADGFIPSEGVASIVLMKASEAKRLNLRPYGRIVGMASGHDGHSNGLMAPNSQSQAAVIAQAYQKHGLDMQQVGYLETHGTGTKLGDPIEIKGLTDAFKQAGKTPQCYLGASKAVIGHTLVSSGLASVIKTLLAFQHNTLPPIHKIEEKNVHIDFGNFALSEKPLPWPEDKPLAAISAFGFAGANSHLILAQCPQPTHKVTRAEPRTFVFCLSANNDTSLALKIAQYQHVCQRLSPESLEVLSRQLSFDIETHDKRVAIVADNVESLQKRLVEAIGLSSYQTPQVLGNLDQISPQSQKRLTSWLAKAPCEATFEPYPAPPLSLPSYPFDRQSYWISEMATEVQGAVTQQPNQGEEALVLQQLKTGISELLGFEQKAIGADKPLHAFGVDSLSAIKLLAPFKGITPPFKPQDLFQYDSLTKLAKEIAKRNKPDITVPLPKPNLSKGKVTHAKQGRLHKIEGYETTGIQWLQSLGGEQPILLLPPLNISYQGWTQQFKYLERHGYQVYVPVYPGHDGNMPPKDGFNGKEVVEGINAFLQGQFDGKPVPAVGWSLGGCFGLNLAQQYPEALSSLVLVSVATAYGPDILDKTLGLQDDLAAHKNYLEVALGNQVPIIQRVSAGADFEVLKHYYQFLQNFDVRAKLHTIQTPALVVRGSEDSVVTMDDIRWLAKLPNYQMVAVEGHGHFVPLTAPRVFNKHVVAFCRQYNLATATST